MMEQPLAPALKPHILVVDDDDRLRELLGLYLTENGFVVCTADGAEAARNRLRSLAFDLMVLDVMMPGETGFELARWLREKGAPGLRQLPVMLLTAKGEVADRIEGLETGADDYLSKPFEPKELLLRLHAILRRTATPPSETPVFKLGRWTYDPARDELRSDTETLRLTDMEAGLMRILSAEPGSVVSRDVLAEHSRGEVNDRTIDVQVTRLRRKIEEDPKNPRYLLTVRGEGYMLMPDANA